MGLTISPGFVDRLSLIGSAYFDCGTNVILNAVYTGIVSSAAIVTKGRYQINFASAEPDLLYRVSGTCGDIIGNQLGYYLSPLKGTKTTNSFQIQSLQDYRSPVPVDAITIQVFRPN